MKECELCKYPARMYCESDQASLCWDCDAKVHCANFLVARHSRNLLCHVCQSPTPWKASGAKLGPTVSVCERCANNCNGRGERGVVDEEGRGENDGDDENEEEPEDDSDADADYDDENDDDAEDEDEDGDGDDDEDGDNQVVPWSCTTPPPPPPPVTSSSSGDESSSSGRNRGTEESTTLFSFKRMRENADLGYQYDLGFSASQPNNDRASVEIGLRCSNDDEATSYGSFRPLKDLKRTPTTSPVQPESTTAALLSSLERFQHDGVSGEDATAMILGICKLTKDPKPVDILPMDHH